MELLFGGITLITTIIISEVALSIVQQECLQQPTYRILEIGVRQQCKARYKTMPKITINSCTRGELARLTSYTIYNKPIAIQKTSDISFVNLEEELKHLQVVDGHALQAHIAMNLYHNLTLTSFGIIIIIQVQVVLIYSSEAKHGREFFFKVQVKDSQIQVHTLQIH